MKIAVPNSRFYLVSTVTSGLPGHMVEGPGRASVTVPISAGVPILMKGGSIVPQSERARRSVATMVGDPVTLVVAVSRAGTAHGTLYMDDGTTTDHESAGSWLSKTYSLEAGKMSSRDTPGRTAKPTKPYKTKAMVERIVFLGAGKCALPKATLAVAGEAAREVSCECPDAAVDRMVCRKPWAPVDSDWDLQL
jgi:alpha 1,3-glucosidase